MNRVATVCPSCGEVTIHTDSVLIVNADEDLGAQYLYQCPECDTVHERPMEYKWALLVLLFQRYGELDPPVVHLIARRIDELGGLNQGVQ